MGLVTHNKFVIHFVSVAKKYKLILTKAVEADRTASEYANDDFKEKVTLLQEQVNQLLITYNTFSLSYKMIAMLFWELIIEMGIFWDTQFTSGSILMKWTILQFF